VQYRTLPWQNLVGWDHHQREYHPVSYYPVGPPMARLWRPMPMIFPPWAGWYGLWALPSTHFHPGWLEPARGFYHGGYYPGDNRYGGLSQYRERGSSNRKTRLSRMPNQNIRFPRRKPKLLGSCTNSGYGNWSLLLRFLGVVRTRKGQGVNLQQMIEGNKMWRNVQSRL
jgi:hypothetical protein